MPAASSPDPAFYRTLEPALIIATAEKLNRRVAERFPEAGLTRVSAELVSLAHDLAMAASVIQKPILWLRAITALVVVLGLVVILFVAAILPFDSLSQPGGGLSETVQGVDASVNTLLLAGLGLLALIRAEERIKRRRVFEKLHGLRSLIHVIDMHQLTKDPVVLSEDFKPTAHSPERITDAADLSRYLDYCSEMLSLTGKIAALFAQSVNDEVVVNAVNDIENLGSNLSRKIWQKITLIQGASVPTPRPDSARHKGSPVL